MKPKSLRIRIYQLSYYNIEFFFQKFYKKEAVMVTEWPEDSIIRHVTLDDMRSVFNLFVESKEFDELPDEWSEPPKYPLVFELTPEGIESRKRKSKAEWAKYESEQHLKFFEENPGMSQNDFEAVCKKFGIQTKDGKIVHPLFEEEFTEDDLKSAYPTLKKYLGTDK